MGTVYRARHKTLGRICAVKVLDRNLIDQDNWKRFQIEARSISNLEHSCFVKVYDLALHDNQQPYYVMDNLVGETLEERLRLGPLPVTLALSVFLEMAEGLAFVHKLGVVHRDLKPGNIFIEDLAIGKQSVKILDFGIAKLIGMDRNEQSLTGLGEIFGTPYYMSPEQCLGESVDARSDIYSFGCVLFEAVTGSPPFVSKAPMEIVEAHISSAPPRAGEAAKEKLPPGLGALIDRCLAKDVDERYQNMTQVIAHLRLIGKGEGHKIEVERKESDPSGGRGAKSGLVLLAVAAFLCLGLTALMIIQSLNKDDSVDKAIESSRKSTDESQGVSDIFGQAVNEGTTLTGVLIDTRVLRETGATESEIKQVKDYDWDTGFTNQMVFSKKVNDFIASKKAIPSIGKDGQITLHFPRDFALGYVSIDGAKPVAAVGDVQASKSDSITLYMSMWTKATPELLAQFGPDCLTGLDCVFACPEWSRTYIENQHRLRELCFFNCIMKCLPKQEHYGESALIDSDLLWIDKLPHIESLGLCGQMLSKEAIARMHCLKRISTLKLCNIKELPALLPEIAKLDNITELWICNVDLTDEDLKALVPMKNLHTLRIRRSKLTAHSLSTFSAMSGLTHLILDRPFSPEEKRKFTTELADCQFEPVFDISYWGIYQMQ